MLQRGQEAYVCACACVKVCVHVCTCVHTCAGTIAVLGRLGWVTSTMNDTVLDNKPECLSQAGATISASEPDEVQDPELPQELWVIPWGWRWRMQGGNLKRWHPALHTTLLRKWDTCGPRAGQSQAQAAQGRNGAGWFLGRWLWLHCTTHWHNKYEK